MTSQVQAIVVREIRESRTPQEDVGVGQSPDATYSQIQGLLMQIQGYFDQIVQQNPQDLIAPRLSNMTTQLWSLVQQYNSEVAAMLQDCSNKLGAAQTAASSTSTQLQQTQAQAASGVSPQAAAGIAIASALVGGLAGYAVRGKL